ncbi:50S ribosomal protein L10 [Candidatus Woesearchaeota archaeon]|nr:50S ribosomal protein L10 [Candidatus Woesearchaeota archaeon]
MATAKAAYKAHVSDEKKKTVKEFADFMRQYPIIAAVNMENLPAKQLQNMRAMLRAKGVVLRMTKRRLLKLAIAQAKKDKPGVEAIEQYLSGMPALLFAKENPFSLYKTLQKNKSSAPAKAGQVAPKDIIVPAGATPFAPGPVIGELGQAGIKAGIEGGKVVIKQDSVAVKAGQVIKPNVAAILTRLSIEPMEIGMDLIAAYENGTIYTKDVLGVDEAVYINNVTKAATWAFNLAMDVAFPTKATTTVLVTKAFNDAKALAISQGILADKVVADVLGKAYREMRAVKHAAHFE